MLIRCIKHKVFIRSISRKKISAIRRAIALLSLVVLAMLALNMVVSKPVSMPTYSININRINPMGAAPGNSNRLIIDASVIQSGYFVCGLNAGNFILNTLEAPSNGHQFVIYSIGVSSTSIGGYHSSCNYSISVAPASNQGEQYTWGEGTYSLQLDYIKNGRQLANKTFNFTVI